MASGLAAEALSPICKLEARRFTRRKCCGGFRLGGENVSQWWGVQIEYKWWQCGGVVAMMGEFCVTEGYNGYRWEG